MWIDSVMILLTLTNLIVLGTGRLSACIRIVACQGVALGILPVLTGSFDTELLVFSAVMVTVKGVVFPAMLLRTLRQLNINRENDPYVGYGHSLLIGILAFVFSWWIGIGLPLPETIKSPMVAPVSLFTLIVGLFLIVSRKKALTQVIGYLILENGIYAFGVSVVHKQPLLIELAILLDIFVAVFVMGITIFHISRQFDHIDTDRLSGLRS